MITPQAIKDQEFQVKFRGYDAIEVKAYLELLAEDFFELTEQNRVQAEEIESLIAEQESLEKANDGLAAEVKICQENADGIQSETQEGYKQRDQQIDALKAELEAVGETVSTLEEENKAYQELIAEMEEQLASDKGSSMQGQAEIEKLRTKIDLLEEQKKELKQEDQDFKNTILAAHKFADNLRQNSKEEARAMIEEARGEVEKVRQEAKKDLERLPLEIEALHRRKVAVREELKGVLHSYLESLDNFAGNEDAEDDETRDDS
ncbi:MAG: DivIVA domain-containing protein [Desulforhopalus sp.]